MYKDKAFFLNISPRILFSLVLSIGFITLFLINLLNRPTESDIKSYSDGFRKLSTEMVFEELPIEEVEKYYDLIGPDEMLDIVDENPICHLHGHNIGKVIYKRTQDLTSSFQICKDRCTTSCFHGVLMERFKLQDGGHVTIDDVKNQALTICTENNSEHPIPKGSCFHAIGHAFMHMADYDVQKGVHSCTTFENPLVQYQCASGAYMERDISYGVEDTQKNEFYPCLNSEFPAACFKYKIKYIFNKYSVDTLAKKCIELQKDSEEIGCFNGIGYASIMNLLENPESMETLCIQGTKNDKLACIDGSVGSIGIMQPEFAKKLCTYVAGEEKEHCLKSAATGLTFEEPNTTIYFQ